MGVFYAGGFLHEEGEDREDQAKGRSQAVGRGTGKGLEKPGDTPLDMSGGGGFCEKYPRRVDQEKPNDEKSRMGDAFDIDDALDEGVSRDGFPRGGPLLRTRRRKKKIKMKRNPRLSLKKITGLGPRQDNPCRKN